MGSNDFSFCFSNQANVRLITTQSGVKHGTVTARINNKSQYEITTLRIDRRTDGRHATQVEFVNDWKIDSSRRDLTINSMFIDLNGVLYDYFGGEQDLRNKRIRFVGDTAKRVQEDYLRIFRYFRFHSRFGEHGKHDQTTLDIMKNNLDGLKGISGERIWTEMKKILACGLKCKDSIQVMFQHMAMGEYLGFMDHDGSVDLLEFERVLCNFGRCEGKEFKPFTLFASLVTSIDELVQVTARLHLSNIERDTIAYIINNREEPLKLAFDAHLLRARLALTHRPNQQLVKEQVLQFLLYQGAPCELIRQLDQWEIPAFPFKGNKIIGNRVNRKTDIATLLNELKRIWAENDFQLSEKDVSEHVERIVKKLNIERSVNK